MTDTNKPTGCTFEELFERLKENKIDIRITFMKEKFADDMTPVICTIVGIVKHQDDIWIMADAKAYNRRTKSTRPLKPRLINTKHIVDLRPWKPRTCPKN